MPPPHQSAPRSPHGSAARIFISYARADGEASARDVQSRLNAAGITAWRDLPHMDGGEPITAELDRAIEQAEHLVLSRSALTSKWVRQELMRARRTGTKISAAPAITRSELEHWRRAHDIYDPTAP